MNKNKLHDKQEPNSNPYNPKKEDFEHYKNKYLEKEESFIIIINKSF